MYQTVTTSVQLVLCCVHGSGAHIVGTNCHFDGDTTLKAIKLMKEALEREGFSNTYLMTQPLAYWTKDCNKQGFIDLPEFPFGKSATPTYTFLKFLMNVGKK